MLNGSTLRISIPPEYPEFLSLVSALAVPELILYALPLQSVADYSLTQHGNEFPRPSEHFVIADYMIDLPIIAVDLGTDSSTYGRVLGYVGGDYWIIADSLFDFAGRLKINGDNALFGKV